MDNKKFWVKTLMIDAFDGHGNGCLCEKVTLKSKVPLVAPNGTSAEFCDELRRLVILLHSHKILQWSSRLAALHIKTNTTDNMAVSCLLKLDQKEENGNDTRTGDTKSTSES